MTADDWFGHPPSTPPPPNANRMMMWACTVASAIEFALLITEGHPLYFVGSVGFALLSYVYRARN